MTIVKWIEEPIQLDQVILKRSRIATSDGLRGIVMINIPLGYVHAYFRCSGIYGR